MNTQPEALRLATILQTSGWQPTQQELLEAAAELRRLYQSEREGWRYADELEQERKRLHEVNQMLVESAEMALEALEMFCEHGAILRPLETVETLRQAIEQAEKQEPVVVLPDGSAFGVMSYPLPKTHWLYAERGYRDGEHEPIELGKPILTHELRGAVVSAVRYAVRGATNCGKEMDFDPDALVQNAVYALCGPYSPSVDAVNMKQERVDETAKGKHKWVGLTELELRMIYCNTSEYRDFWEAYSAKLKEKNG